MKRWISVFLIAVMCLSLCACGSPAPAEVTAEPTAAPTTEPTEPPVPDTTVYIKAPADWRELTVLAGESGKPDVSESRPEESSLSGWLSTDVSGLTDRVTVVGNGGAVQTAELTVETGKSVWIHIVNEDYVFTHYEQPDDEQLETEQNEPALDYHRSIVRRFHQGDYQISGTKVITCDERDRRYSTDYIPDEYQPENAEEIYYVVVIEKADQQVGWYSGFGGSMKMAVKPGVVIRIQELATYKILRESEKIMGGDPPASISSDHNGRGAEPDEAEIRAWIENALADILKNPPAELPVMTGSYPGFMWDHEILNLVEYAERRQYSREELVEHLIEYEEYTREEAEATADICAEDWGVVWKK